MEKSFFRPQKIQHPKTFTTHLPMPSNRKRKPGGGRKPQYPEPTTTIAFRVPVSQAPKVKVLIADFLAIFKASG